MPGLGKRGNFSKVSTLHGLKMPDLYCRSQVIGKEKSWVRLLSKGGNEKSRLEKNEFFDF